MKLLKFMGFLGIVILFQGCPSSKNVLQTKKLVVKSDRNSLLWEVSGNGLTSPSYVFGTVHMIAQKDFEMPDTLSALITHCEQITFEVNMDEMTDQNNMISILMKSVMKNGTTLKDLLSAEDYKKVEARFDEIGLPLYMVERIKPMILSVMLSTDLSNSSQEAMASYEMRIMQMTKKMSKKMNGLETLDFQMSMFDSIPYPVQAKMMMSSFDGDTQSNEFNEMVRLYKSQDIESMSKMVVSSNEFRPYENLLIRNRNEKWIPTMKAQMTQLPTLFAVGAGHLGGSFGIIALLKKAGFTVRPIRFSFNKTIQSNGTN